MFETQPCSCHYCRQINTVKQLLTFVVSEESSAVLLPQDLEPLCFLSDGAKTNAKVSKIEIHQQDEAGLNLYETKYKSRQVNIWLGTESLCKTYPKAVKEFRVFLLWQLLVLLRWGRCSSSWTI